MRLLQQSVSSVIAEGRIGSPMFLRCMAHLPVADTNIFSRMAALVAVANTWMPSPPERIYAPNQTDSTQITAMVQYTGGQTAMLSLNRIPEAQDTTVNLLLIGNKGVIQHDTPVERHRLMQPPIKLSGGEELIKLIEAAIKAGTPLEFKQKPIL